MNEFWNKNKVTIVVVLLMITALIILYFTVLKKGTQAGIDKVLSNIPDKPGDSPLTDQERANIRSLTDRLKADMIWYKQVWHDTELYSTLRDTTDRILLGVYNQYRSDTGQDMIADLQNTFAIGNQILEDSQTVVKRLKHLLNQ